MYYNFIYELYCDKAKNYKIQLILFYLKKKNKKTYKHIQGGKGVDHEPQSESKGKQEVEGSTQPRQAVQLGRTLAGGGVGSCEVQAQRAEVGTRPRRRD